MPRKLRTPLGLLLGLVLLVPSSSSAATTFGATVGPPSGGSPSDCMVTTLGLPKTCTILNSNVAEGGGLAPAGLVAPSSGVITRWRVSLSTFGAITSMTAAPRVFSIAQLNKLTPLRTGTPRPIPGGGGQLTFEDRLKVSTGDRFGLDLRTDGPVGSGPVAMIVDTTPFSAGFLSYTPPLADGSVTTLPLIGLGTTSRFQINADVEPDADLDGFGDETQDLCTSRADVQAVCPPPTVSKPTFSKGVFSFTSDIPGKASTTLFKVSDGRKVGQKCKSKRKRGKKCKIYTKFAAWNDDVVPGANKIDYAYKVGGKSLKPGKYRATIVITSAQNTVTTQTVDFTIKKSSKKKK